MRAAATYLLCLMLPGASDASETDAARDALSGAVAVCSDLSSSEADVTAALTKAGWHQNSDETRGFVPPFTIFFHMAYSDESVDSLEQGLESAAFMAGSVLHNSALPSDQPTYVYEAMTLGVYALSKEKPGCSLSGPIWVKDALIADTRFNWVSPDAEQLYQYKDLEEKTVLTSYDADVTAGLSHVNMAKARKAYASANTMLSDRSAQFWEQYSPFVGDVAATIAPSRSSP